MGPWIVALFVFVLMAGLPASAAVSWPLKVHSSGRYLVDQAGTPFYIHGDSAWNIPGNLDTNAVRTYLNDAQSRGITALLFRPATPHYGTNSPYNHYGVLPYTGGDFTKPIEDYWKFVDYCLNECKSRDMVCFLTPMYYANTDANGYRDEMASQGTTVATTWGNWIGARYKAQGNIVWLGYGDCDTDGGTQGRAWTRS